MSQTGKYEKQYREKRNVCGDQFPEIAEFFDTYPKQPARVLDLGCGQGRDALMVARHGHSVLGVDISGTGVQQMKEDANRENLQIQGAIADITDYEIDEDFDVVILDRVLHMLKEEVRIGVLKRVMRRVLPGGFILIADMQSNKPSVREAFACGSGGNWTSILDRKGFLFVRKEPAD